MCKCDDKPKYSVVAGGFGSVLLCLAIVLSVVALKDFFGFFAGAHDTAAQCLSWGIVFALFVVGYAFTFQPKSSEGSSSRGSNYGEVQNPLRGEDAWR